MLEFSNTQESSFLSHPGLVCSLGEVCSCWFNLQAGSPIFKDARVVPAVLAEPELPDRWQAPVPWLSNLALPSVFRGEIHVGCSSPSGHRWVNLKENLVVVGSHSWGAS